MPPLVSIIIPARNSERCLRPCLEAVGQLDRLPEAEVLVIDNGSTDGTAVVARSFPFVRLLEEPRRGAAAARNRGCREACGRYFAFTDSDCRPSPSWLSDLLPALEGDASLGGVGGHIAAVPSESLTARYIDWRHIFSAELMFEGREQSPPFFMTANAIYRREAIEQAGGFDERLWPSEDADLAWRVGWAGWKLAQFPGRGVVFHDHRSSPAGFARMMFLYGAGSAELFAKHRQRFGARVQIDGVAYWNLVKSLLKIPVCPFLFSDPVQKRRGLFDTINHGCFIAGRWWGSMRNRVLAL
ncbi:glycosyltransferase [Candidatus Poribacteria bacterium]|nr:glycosyltransferase [Candidatus Poribacteria bacterium]